MSDRDPLLNSINQLPSRKSLGGKPPALQDFKLGVNAFKVPKIKPKANVENLGDGVALLSAAPLRPAGKPQVVARDTKGDPASEPVAPPPSRTAQPRSGGGQQLPKSKKRGAKPSEPAKAGQAQGAPTPSHNSGTNKGPRNAAAKKQVATKTAPVADESIAPAEPAARAAPQSSAKAPARQAAAAKAGAGKQKARFQAVEAEPCEQPDEALASTSGASGNPCTIEEAAPSNNAAAAKTGRKNSRRRNGAPSPGGAENTSEPGRETSPELGGPEAADLDFEAGDWNAPLPSPSFFYHPDDDKPKVTFQAANFPPFSYTNSRACFRCICNIFAAGQLQNCSTITTSCFAITGSPSSDLSSRSIAQPEKPSFRDGDAVVAYMKNLARDADQLLPQEQPAKDKKRGRERKSSKPDLPLREALQQSWGGLVRCWGVQRGRLGGRLERAENHIQPSICNSPMNVILPACILL